MALEGQIAQLVAAMNDMQLRTEQLEQQATDAEAARSCLSGCQSRITSGTTTTQTAAVGLVMRATCSAFVTRWMATMMKAPN